jgi:hypothetical protein
VGDQGFIKVIRSVQLSLEENVKNHGAHVRVAGGGFHENMVLREVRTFPSSILMPAMCPPHLAYQRASMAVEQNIDPVPCLPWTTAHRQHTPSQNVIHRGWDPATAHELATLANLIAAVSLAHVKLTSTHSWTCIAAVHEKPETNGRAAKLPCPQILCSHHEYSFYSNSVDGALRGNCCFCFVTCADCLIVDCRQAQPPAQMHGANGEPLQNLAPEGLDSFGEFSHYLLSFHDAYLAECYSTDDLRRYFMQHADDPDV